jgi:hypothetical protein
MSPGEDSEATQMKSALKNSAAAPVDAIKEQSPLDIIPSARSNGFEHLGTFNDLPSVKSNDLLSQVQSISSICDLPSA